jgi:hypothetical protein
MLMCPFGGVSLVVSIIVLDFAKKSLTVTLILTVVFVLIVIAVDYSRFISISTRNEKTAHRPASTLRLGITKSDTH